MVVRKNISLEKEHIKKLRVLTEKHNGNLSAAIRDAINITDSVLIKYGTIENAFSSLIADEKELTSRERSIDMGKNVLLSSHVFLWMLKWTKGIFLDTEILEELLDPMKINTISELDEQINHICRESGWNCEVSIFCMDNIDPTSLTIEIKGNNDIYRRFVAELVVLFLVNNKNLDIDKLYKRATAIRIDMKSYGRDVAPEGAIKEFGYLNEIMEELLLKETYWKNLIELFCSVNYNMVSISREHYEQLLACDAPIDTGIFESVSKKHISSIPHSDFLKLLKKTHESMKIIDKIEIIDNNINVYHNFKSELAIKKIKDYYLTLLKVNGHQYEAKYSTSLIVLDHVCCHD